MSIVPLQKVTIFGGLADREGVLAGLQQLGFLHLVDLENAASKRPLEQAERNEVAAAIRYLAASPVQNPQQRSHYPEGQSSHRVAREVLRRKHRSEVLSDQAETLQRQIEALEPWGEFDIGADRVIGEQRLWFYALPHHEIEQLEQIVPVSQRISQDRQAVNVVVVQPEPPNLPWPDLELPARPLSELRREWEAVQEELETLHWERVEETHWLTLLQLDLAEADDRLERLAAAHHCLAAEPVFALQAWVPEGRLADLTNFANSHRLALIHQAPELEDQPPTLLDNPPSIAGAEEAVRFYMTPAYRSWDPTWIMYFSFTAFFAMIVADAAYGLIFGIGLLLAWKRLSETETRQRLRNLLLAIVIATVVYGVATGSYFGMTPRGLAWLQIQVEGQPLLTHKDAMMILSLGIGVGHLVLANLITAWQQRKRAQAWAAVGWAVGIFGGYLWGLFDQPTHKAAVWLAETMGREAETFQPLLKWIGQLGLGGGLLFVLLFTSSRPLWSRRPSDWGWRLLDGLLGLTNVTKAFGDVLSYLRLFALGFASAQLAVTFNQMAAGMQTIPGVGILLAILVFVLGHTVNMGLGIMGGVVHGLRLNCIEFFNWSLTEEGHPFRPFSKKAT